MFLGHVPSSLQAVSIISQFDKMKYSQLPKVLFLIVIKKNICHHYKHMPSDALPHCSMN